jgi:hypothetical protein
MKRWIAQLDTACAWVNPGLVIAALILAVLDIAAARQRWTFAHTQAAVRAKTVVVAAKSKKCAPVLPPELRDMIGRD